MRALGVKSLPAMILVLGLPAGFLPFNAAAQNVPATVESRIALIREHYASVQSRLDEFRQETTSYVEMPGGGEFSRWYDGDALRKLSVTFDADGFSARREFFFWDGLLFFVYTEDETFPIWPDQDPKDFGKTENRYYFDGDVLLRWLRSSFENEGRAETMSPEGDEYSRWRVHFLEEANVWCAFAASGGEDMDAFREAFDGVANACSGSD